MSTSLKNTKALVTGCAGFIPSHVAEGLLKKGMWVTGVDDLSTGKRDNMASFLRHPRFRFIQKDIANKKLVHALVHEADYIYHGAVRGVGVSVRYPERELKVNIYSTLLILEAIRRYGCTRFIFPSSASVYGNPSKIPEAETDPTLPLSPYGVSKLAAERYCLSYHHLFQVPVVCLRYFNTYGPHQNPDSIYGGVIPIFINQALRDQPLTIFGTGKQTRDFTYIADNLRATLTAFTAPGVLGQVINIASGQEYSVNLLAHKILKLTEQKQQNHQHSPGRIIDNIARRRGDIKKAFRLLRFQPHCSLDQGLQKTYAWLKRNSALKNHAQI